MCHNGVIDLQPHIQSIHHQLAVSAEAGGEEARALAERLAAPLDAALRLALQDALAAAAEEITCELAPGSVELRLRGRSPEFVVTLPLLDSPAEAPDGWPSAADGVEPPSRNLDEGAMARINLRLPDHLKARIERAAGAEGMSVNQWLVRAAAAAVDRGDQDRRREPCAPRSAQRYTGWAH